MQLPLQSTNASVRVIALSVIGAVLILILGFTYVALASSTVQAQLHVESGTVLLNGNEVTGTVPLNQGDVIETKKARPCSQRRA